jgi:hypothetical protein
MDLNDLVRIIGYQLTAFIGSTDKPTVVRWLHDGVPEAMHSRMQVALDIAAPIEQVESELVAQGFLIEEICGLGPYRCAAEMLREGDVRIARAVLTERVRKAFLENVAADLEGVELRLRQWISQANLPPRIGYYVHMSPDGNRLWLQLIHIGFPLDRQRQWDRGEDWPAGTTLSGRFQRWRLRGPVRISRQALRSSTYECDQVSRTLTQSGMKSRNQKVLDRSAVSQPRFAVMFALVGG